MTYSNTRKYVRPDINIIYFEETISTAAGLAAGAPSSYTFAANEQNQVIYNITGADATTTTRIQQFNNVIEFNK